MSAEVVEITDADDPRVAGFRALNDARARRRIEAPTSFHPGTFVIEGWLALARALDVRVELQAVLVLDTRLDRLSALLAGRAPADTLHDRSGRGGGRPATTGAPSSARPVVYVGSAAVIAGIVGFDLHRGVVAVATRSRPLDPATVAARARRLLAIEGVTDTENLGVLFRNAAALGAQGVLVDPTTPDPLNRRTVRVSTGHVLALPWARLGPGGIAALAAERTVVALSPGGDVDLRDVEPTPRLAVLVGAEGPGLTGEALATATVRARIPMARDVDSVNVATAAAIAMWHLFAPDLPRAP